MNCPLKLEFCESCYWLSDKSCRFPPPNTSPLKCENLQEPAVRRIHFVDDGQDCLWWDIDGQGVVTACSAQEWVWKGMQIKMTNHSLDASNIRPGDILACVFPDGRLDIYGHRVEKVETCSRESGNPVNNQQGGVAPAAAR